MFPMAPEGTLFCCCCLRTLGFSGEVGSLTSLREATAEDDEHASSIVEARFKSPAQKDTRIETSPRP